MPQYFFTNTPLITESFIALLKHSKMYHSSQSSLLPPVMLRDMIALLNVISVPFSFKFIHAWSKNEYRYLYLRECGSSRLFWAF